LGLRRAYRQSLAILGLVMLSQGSVAMAAPICSSLFVAPLALSPTHSVEVELVVSDLAHMKLAIDQALALGDSSLMAIHQRDLFNKKMAGLNQMLKGQMNSQQVSELVRSKIHENQVFNDVQKNRETEIRVAQSETIRKIPSQELIYQVPLPEATYSSRVHYFAPKDKLVFKIKDSLIEMDVATQVSRVITENVETYGAFGNKMTIVNKEGRVSLYDGLTGQILDSALKVDPLTTTDIEISPKTDWLAMTEMDNVISFSDIRTGTAPTHSFILEPTKTNNKTTLGQKMNDWYWHSFIGQERYAPAKINRVVFVNEHQVLIFTDKNTLYSFDFISGEKRTLDFNRYFRANFKHSESGRLIISKENKITVLDGENFNEIETKSTSAEIPNSFLDPKFIFDDHIMITQKEIDMTAPRKHFIIDGYTLEKIERLNIVENTASRIPTDVPALDRKNNRLFMFVVHQPDGNKLPEYFINFYRIVPPTSPQKTGP